MPVLGNCGRRESGTCLFSLTDLIECPAVAVAVAVAVFDDWLYKSKETYDRV